MTWIAIPLSLLTASRRCSAASSHSGFVELATVIALTGGIVVAVALFDVLPEAIDGIDVPRRVTTLVGAGFIGFFLVERVLVLHHRDEPDRRAPTRGSAPSARPASRCTASSTVSGSALPSTSSTSTGLLVFVAVISHDFADGMNTVSFVLRQTATAGARWLAVDAAAPLLGAIVGILVDSPTQASVTCSRSTPASSSTRRDRPSARGARAHLAAADRAHALRLLRVTYAIVTVASH